MIWFNEINPTACAVLRHCYPGAVVIERSIKDLTPDDVAGPGRRHFFAGAGLWEVAAQLAGWPDDLDLWTGSCPCQPFSAAGKGRGVDDPRHLWPDLFRLVRGCRPGIVVGEQVSGKAGYGWLDGVRADLEAEGYACWAVDIPASAVDAPHQRNRLYWCAVADAYGRDAGAERQFGSRQQRQQQTARNDPGFARNDQRPESAMADADDRGRRRRSEDALGFEERRNAAQRVAEPMEHTQGLGRGEGRAEHELWGWRDSAADADGAKSVEHAERSRLEGLGGHGDDVGQRRWLDQNPPGSTPAANGSFWSGAEWVECADGKARRTKPGLRLLVDGMAGRVDLWRLAGNSIVAPVAAEVLAALLDTIYEN